MVMMGWVLLLRSSVLKVKLSVCVCVWPIKHQDAYFPPCSTGQTVYFLLTGAQIHLAVRGASTSNPFKKIHNINVTNFSYCDTKESVVDMLCTNENS